MQDFRKIRVWERSHRLVIRIYKATANFPKEEIYGLTSQLRRASVSIPSNIAEGSSRDGDAEFCRFLHISIGSASEIDYQLMLAHDLGYLNDQDYKYLSSEVNIVRQKLIALIQSIKGETANKTQVLPTA